MSQELQVFIDAVAFATEAHHNQRRKASTDPYIAHPIRVAYLAIDAGLSMNVCAAAVLHDVVEDCNIDILDIYDRFPRETCLVVRALTKWWPDNAPEDEKAANRAIYYAGIMANQDAINVKMLDRADNLRDMLLLLPQETKWVRRYVVKTNKEFEKIYPASNNPAIQELFKANLSLLTQKLEDQRA